MPARATEAICIQTAPYGDTSQVVHWITRDLGRVAGLAKGAFRDKNGYQGSEDLLTLSRVVIYQGRGSGLALLRDRKVVEMFRGLRSRIDRHAAGFVLVETVRRAVQEGQKIRGLFDLLTAALYALDTCGPERDIILFAFLGAFLKMLGFEPVLGRCTLCERDAAGARKLYVNPQYGGVVCRACRSGVSGGMTISAAAAGVIRAAPAADLGRLRNQSLDAAVTAEAWGFFELYLTHLFEREVKSIAYARSRPPGP